MVKIQAKYFQERKYSCLGQVGCALYKDSFNNDRYPDSTSNMNQIDEHFQVVRIKGSLNWMIVT